MADTSSCLSLPFIQPNQAQKHVTHNEALRILDLLTQLGVQADDLPTPPASPAEGDRYIVGDAGRDEWAGQDANIALFENGVWQFFTPKPGWRAYVIGRETLIVHDGTDWIDLDSAELQEIEGFGLGMVSLPSSPFSAKLNAALWTALYQEDGGDGSVISTLNKETSTHDAGFILQQNFETRGLLGLFGNDDFRLATSADGTVFHDGLIVESGTGVVSQPNLPRFKGVTNFDNYLSANAWTKIAINLTEFNDQNAFDAANNHFVAPATGSYVFAAALTFKQNASSQARIGARMLRNGTEVISGSVGENTGPHISEQTTLNTQCMVLLNAGDTVELQGHLRGFDGYFLADQTSFWGYKVG